MKINLKKLSNKPKPSRRWSVRKTAIIVGIVLFSLLLPNVTQAGVFEFLFGDKFSAANIAQSFLVFIADGIFWLLHWAVRAGAAVFDAMLKIGFQSHLDVVKGGWEVSRNIANMFFILFLVIIAFATILRIEKYGIKQLLPKIITIALLINFSLVICSVIIDFSNIAAKFFINEIDEFADYGVSANFIDSLKILSVYTPIASNCDDLSNDVPFGPPAPGQTMPTKSPRQECEEAQVQTDGSGNGVSIVNFFISTTVGSLVLLIAAFVLFAGAFMLLIRIVILWFLLMLVPLVFICYIMPSLRKMWQDWWKTFLRWCLFAPAYAFFVWLAMKISVETRNKPIAEIPSSGFVDQGGLGNLFTADPGTALIHYFFIIALLLGGLIAAQKFGIYGSGAAMNIVQRAGKGARSWAGARTRERVAKPMEALSRGMTTTFGKVPGLRKLAQLPTMTMATQRANIEKEKKNLSKQSVDTIKSLYPTYNRTQKIAAAQLMAKEGKFSAGGNFKDKDVEKIMKTASIYGKDMAGPMLSNRPDLAPAIGLTKKEVIEKINPAKAGDIQSQSFEDKETLDLMLANFRGGHLAKIAETNTKGADALQKTIHDLDVTPTSREAKLNAINPKLTIYINNTAAKGTGDYTFA